MQLRNKLLKFYANFLALWGRTKEERHAIRHKVYRKHFEKRTTKAFSELMPGVRSESLAFELAQNILFPREVESAERIMIFVVPEHNEMSGGIFSIFSIANQMRKIKRLHGYEIIILTRPNFDKLTYLRHTSFRNSETVFRFEQITRCQAARDIYIHLPEYAAATFYDNLSEVERNYLGGIKSLHINLLNQNIKLMPEAHQISPLYRLTPNLSQSVAHHAYFSQDIADRYRLPTLFQPAYTDLSEYPGSSFRNKEDLIIYSPDEAPHKEECLRRIGVELPEYVAIEIRGITFDRFMELATRCRFAISFGEGFDGYLAQPIHQGGISFAVFNDEFFPSPHFRKYYNIFSSSDQMIENICSRMRSLAADEARYSALNEEFCAEYDRLYSLSEYQQQIRKLSLKQFEVWPNNAPNAILRRTGKASKLLALRGQPSHPE